MISESQYLSFVSVWMAIFIFKSFYIVARNEKTLNKSVMTDDRLMIIMICNVMTFCEPVASN